MNNKKKTSLAHRLGALLIVPTLTVGCAIFAIPSVAGEIDSMDDELLSTTVESLATDSVAPDTTAAPCNEEEIYKTVDVMPDFPGGMSELLKFLNENVKYPSEAVLQNIEGSVLVQFVVGKDGRISNEKIVSGVHPLLDEEALRVVRLMPKFIPAKVDGKDVACYLNFPFTFKEPKVVGKKAMKDKKDKKKEKN